MPQRVQNTYNTVILNVREKGGDTKEKLKTKETKRMDRAGIAGSPWGRSGSVVLVLLHMFFQDILRVIYVITKNHT